MNTDERDYLSEPLRARLEDTPPTDDLLVGMMALARSADELESIEYRLVAEAWARRAEERR